jgi:hypothetical protein
LYTKAQGRGDGAIRMTRCCSRDRGAQDVDAAERVRERAGGEGMRPPEESEHVLENQEEPERDEELVLLRPPVEGPQHRRLEDRPGQRGGPGSDQQEQEESGGRERARQEADDPCRHIRAERVEVAVGHVHDAHDAVDEGQPARNEKEDGSVEE